MNKGYRELVGLQVTFSKAEERYSLIHFYRYMQADKASDALSIRGIDVPLRKAAEDTLATLNAAYAPAILFVWGKETESDDSVYLQFNIDSPPDSVDLGSDWTLTGEG